MKLLILILGFSGLLFAQNAPVEIVSDSTIDTYVKDANAIVLSDERIVTVDESEIEYTINRHIRINNKNGDEYDNVTVYESEFIKITDIEAVIKDPLGIVIKELEDDDINVATISSGYLITVKGFNGFSNSYPYEMDYTLSIEFESLIYWPDWKPQLDIPVLSATYKLILEDQVSYNSYKIGFDFEPYVYNEDGNEVHLYSVKNIPPLDRESYLPKEYKTQHAILFAPLKFEFGDSKGSFQSWDEMAKWVNSLFKDRYDLPEPIAGEVRQLVANESDPYKKIEKLYKFLQNKTRYVQIYLDIGGLQPHQAEWVYNNRFGDCKDLATFMIAMLRIAGIKSYPAVVLSKETGHVYKEFPSQQFNHAITFIPLTHDTLWVDCTLDYTGYRDIPYYLENTNALVVKEDKGEIIKIPQRSPTENLKKSFMRAILNRNGSLDITGNIETRGNIKNHYIVNLEVLKSDELKRSLIKEFTYYQPNFLMDNYAFQHDTENESMTIMFSGEYKKFSKKVGKRLFLNPNILNRETQNYVPDDKDDRDYPFDLVKYPYLDIDSLEIKLPRHYTIESAPEKRSIEYPFGKYITTYKIEKGTFYYKRLFEYSVELIAPEEFDTFLEFYKMAVETDKSRFVLKEN